MYHKNIDEKLHRGHNMRNVMNFNLMNMKAAVFAALFIGAGFSDKSGNENLPEIICQITSTEPLTLTKTVLISSIDSVNSEKTSEIWEERANVKIPGESMKLIAMVNPRNQASQGIVPIMFMLFYENKSSRFTIFEPQDLFNESIYFYNGQIDSLQVSKRLGDGFFIVITANGGDWYDHWEAAAALFIDNSGNPPIWLMANYEYSQDDATCMGKKVKYVLNESGMLSMTVIDVCTDRRISIEEISLPELLVNTALRNFDREFQNCRLYKNNY